MRHVRVSVAHRIPDRAPVRLAVGEEVLAGERDTQWPEFVFVTSSHDGGWVPARHLSQPAGPAVVQAAYDTTELPTRVDEVLEVVDEDPASGWLWCRSGDERLGWVPISTVEDI